MTYAMEAATTRARPRRLRIRRMLALAPDLVAALPVAAVAAGLAVTALLAFGHPFDDPYAAGGRGISLHPWKELAATPGIAKSVQLTLWTGIGATVISTALALLACAWAQGRRFAARAAGLGAPLIAAPHSALALGVAFLIAPTGWLVGALSPWLAGQPATSVIAAGGHAYALALVAALVIKQAPFLILVFADAARRLPASRTIAVARTLGYPPAEAFLKVLLPQIYPRVRGVLWVALALSLSVVDVALIVGPRDAGHTPTLAVLALRAMTDHGGRARDAGAAMACLLVAIVAAAIAAWWLLERVVAARGRAWIEGGGRGGMTTLAAPAGAAICALGAIAGALALADLFAWSIAGSWPDRAPWPGSLTLAHWIAQGRDAGVATLATLVVAIATTMIALVLAVGSLECEDRSGAGAAPRPSWVFWVPLLVPQIAYLFGLRVLLAGTRLDGSWIAAIATHSIVVLPCLFLALAGPWHALDRRYAKSARLLGAAPRRVLLRIKLPLLAGPLAIACAIAITASVDQYLPSLFAGSRGVSTLTTRAVALAAGADRSAIGVHATLQWALPLLLCILAFAAGRKGGAPRPGTLA
ncbi:MAG: ABC transporter permease [Candidatus Levyibacteriota bacterium]